MNESEPRNKQTSVEFPVFVFIYFSIYATAPLEIKNADFKNRSKNQNPYKTQ